MAAVGCFGGGTISGASSEAPGHERRGQFLAGPEPRGRPTTFPCISGLFSAQRLDGLPPRDAVGHEKTTMTYGLYSGGVSLAVKREALDKLAY